MEKKSTHPGSLRLLLALFTTASLILAQEPTITRYTSESTSDGLGSNRVYAVAIQPGTNGSTLWFGCRNYGPDAQSRTYVGGLSRLTFDVWGSPTWTNFSPSNSDLPDTWIWDLEFDHDGNLWIATHSAGAAKLDAANLGDAPGTAGWTTYAPSNSSMGYERIYEITVAPDGTIWFGHGAGDIDATVALTIFDGVSQWQTISSSHSALTENKCYTIAFSGDGKAWLGFKFDGVFEFDYNNTPFDDSDDSWTAHTLSYGYINAGATAAHPNGDVWIGHANDGSSDTGGGVSRYVAATGTWNRYEPLVVTDIVSRIRTIHIDSYGVVWLGDKASNSYGSSGVWRFNPLVDTEPQNVYRQTGADEAEHDDDNFINKLAIDETNRVIWLATDFVGGDLDISSGVVKIEGLWEPTDTTTNSVGGELAAMPTAFALAQNYPNPFNPETYIDYVLNEAQYINLSIYDIQGRLIRLLEQGAKAPGTYRVLWNGQDNAGNDVHSGVYIYRLESDQGNRETRKAVLLR